MCHSTLSRLVHLFQPAHWILKKLAKRIEANTSEHDGTWLREDSSRANSAFPVILHQRQVELYCIPWQAQYDSSQYAIAETCQSSAQCALYASGRVNRCTADAASAFRTVGMDKPRLPDHTRDYGPWLKGGSPLGINCPSYRRFTIDLMDYMDWWTYIRTILYKYEQSMCMQSRCIISPAGFNTVTELPVAGGGLAPFGPIAHSTAAVHI